MAAFQPGPDGVKDQVADVAEGPPDAIWSASPRSWLLTLSVWVNCSVQPDPPRVIVLVGSEASVKSAKNSAPAAAGVTEPVAAVVVLPVPEIGTDRSSPTRPG